MCERVYIQNDSEHVIFSMSIKPGMEVRFSTVRTRDGISRATFSIRTKQAV